MGNNGLYLPHSPKAKRIFVYVGDGAKRLGAQKIGTEHSLSNLLRGEETLAPRILVNLGLSLPKMRQLLLKKMGVSEPNGAQRRRNDQSKNTPQGTPALDSLAKDLAKLVQEQSLDPVVGRNAKVHRLIQILNRHARNNPVLVSEPGAGKTAITEGLVQKTINWEVPEDIQDRRLMVLDMGALAAGAKYRGESEDRLKKVVDETCQDGQVTLLTGELHISVGTGGTEGVTNVSNILKPALARGELQTIGVTTLDEYQKYIEKNATLERRFTRIQVAEPTPEEMGEVLEGLRSYYEKRHGIEITDETPCVTVQLSIHYLSGHQLPDETIGPMDESAARVRLNRVGQPSEINELCTETSRLITEKEEAAQNQSLESATRIRQKGEQVMEKLEELIVVKERNLSDCNT